MGFTLEQTSMVNAGNGEGWNAAVMAFVLKRVARRKEST
jgi:hypothetical protein